MKLTALQAHVLANLNRVLPREAKVNSLSARPRYQLDGKECTSQIISLTVMKLIGKHPGGGFRRLGVTKPPHDVRVGIRQPFSASSIDAIRASLSMPETVRTIGAGKR